MTGPRSPVIVAARRTPIGTAGRALHELTVTDLAAPVLRVVVNELGTSQPVNDVILGNCMGPGGNVARVAALAAGLGPGVPGLTVDRQCGSGLEAINLAAGLVRAGAGDLYLAGGVESASTAPLRFWPGDPPVQYSRAPFAPPGTPDPGMGAAADRVAAEGGISRERQDAYAARSHALAVTGFDDMRAELVPVGGLDHDERPRARLTAARLGRLPAAFVPGGTVTAGNSCGVSDGAAVVAVTHGVPGLRVVDWQVSGGDPARPGIALVPAVRALLDRNGLLAGDVGAVEITEAFAGQVLACLDLLGIDEKVVCTGGGAIALGHPWGASGAVLMVRLFTRMVLLDGPALGLAACAIGGGLGVATLVARS
ncbi:thiolase family protein [Virgisporangium aurantiacum]|uniref:thiolase family protein n=1 Tax=Virgisporangium aurantiacum TaxID=175570 RepID=UPI00194ECAC8|nr:thiolase family protein [Virgisporangium aurantiacum]